MNKTHAFGLMVSLGLSLSGCISTPRTADTSLFERAEPQPSETALLTAPADRPLLPVYDADTLRLACKAALEEAKERVTTLEKMPLAAVNVASLLEAWDADGAATENVLGPAYLQAYIHPDARVRAAGEACILHVTEFQTELFQNEALYQRIEQVEPDSEYSRVLRSDLLTAFEESGVNLPLAKRQRAAEIIQLIQVKAQEFQRRVRENDQHITFTTDEVAGLPASWIEQADRDENGNFVVGFDYPQYFPFMRNASSADARRRYYIGFTRRGGDSNLVLMDEVMALRKELATLHGYRSYAELAIRDRMAQTPETVNNFLDSVAARVSVAAQNDVEILRQFKAELDGTPLESTVFNSWDQRYYTEQLRKQRYSIDEEALRAYFPTEASVSWALDIMSEVLGVTIQKADAPLWHPDVQYYDVFDTDSGEFHGGMYLDLYPREGKYKHAAAFGSRSGSTLFERTPISILVTNFDRNGLTQNTLETLMHELGHVFHGVLSRTHYVSHSGTEVKRDFVEAPSQMLEEWARRYQTLSRVADYCEPVCPRITPDLVERLDAASKFAKGSFYARQHLYASFDMALAGSDPQPAMDVWKKMEGATPLGYVEGSQFPGSFSHIIAGYGAGYYGYMWSEVIAVDMQSVFGDDLMDADIGRRYRETILVNGGQKPAGELVEAFLQRPVNADAFFNQLDQ